MNMSIENALIIGINALTGAVVVLFGLFIKNTKDMQAILKLRDKQREEDRSKLAHLERLAGWVNFCPVPDCPARRQKDHDDECPDSKTFSIGKRCSKQQDK